MNDAFAHAEVYRQAARLNLDDSLRRGSLLVFPDYGQLVMTGDLHGHRRNFEKLKGLCDLKNFGARHVVVHEIIHEEIESLTACDTSHELLLEVARWKCAFPDQVHVLQSNHELAQATRHEITKNGRGVTFDFNRGVRVAYGDDAGPVIEAINDWIRSLPLAGRTPNRVLVSHTLPGPRELPYFDPAVLTRLPTDEDLAERGSAHALVWGRHQTEGTLNALSELLDVDFFLCGHQPQEMGYEVLHDRMIILASDHNHGVFLPVNLGKPVTLDRLIQDIRPFAGVG